MASEGEVQRVALAWLVKRAADPYSYPGAGEVDAPPGVVDAVEEFRTLPVEDRKDRPALEDDEYRAYQEEGNVEAIND